MIDGMNPPVLHAEDLLLRPWQPEDADAVARACADPDIQHWTTIPSPYLPEHAVGFVENWAPSQYATGTGVPVGAFDGKTGELLGAVGLSKIDSETHSAEVGYWTAPWARGRGVAETAGRTLLRWAFDELKLERIGWKADVGNHASRLVALRLGFTIDGIARAQRTNGVLRDETWHGSLLAGELTEPAADRPAAPGTLIARQARLFMQPQPVLAVGAITLRPRSETDIPDVILTCRDVESRRWLNLPDAYSEVHAARYATYSRRAWRRGTALECAVANHADRFLGTMSLRISPQDPAVADVGYLTAPYARGTGSTSAALEAICNWGFEELGLERIEWRAQVGNDASRRVAEKVGFRIEGINRALLGHRGQRYDTWIGSLLPRELIDLPGDLIDHEK